MMRLDPVLPSRIREIRFYTQNLFGCSLSVSALAEGKRWLARLAIAKEFHIQPRMSMDPETVESVDGILCEMPLSSRRFENFARNILGCGVEDWKKKYSGTLDKNHWEVSIKCESSEEISSCGDGAYPSEFLLMIQAWDDLILLNSIMQCMAMEPADFKRYGVAV